MKEENVEASLVIKTETDFGSFQCMEQNGHRPMVLDVEDAAFTCSKHELSDPLSIECNDQKPTELELEEADFTSAKCVQYFLIKEIGTVESDDVSPQFQTGVKILPVVDIDTGRQLPETLEQKEKHFRVEGFDERERCLGKKVATGKRPKNETIEQREKRQLVDRIRQQKYREDKAKEVQQKRLKQKIFHEIRMQNETSEQKEKRLLAALNRQRMYRETEAIEEAKQRRLKYRITQRKRLQNETVEQREKRLLDARIKARMYRKKEKSEQHERRLLQGMAWRHRKRSKVKKAESKMEAEYQLDFDYDF